VQYGFAPERLSVGGYAEFHPIASNSSEEGRALNRRVDVVILSKPASAEMRAPEKPFASDAKPANYLEPQAPPSF
jgi:chemotaxis protein MotB